MSANTAIHIVALPNTASTKNTALMPSASTMFCHSSAWVRRDSRIVSATLRRSSFMISTSAASLAVSVPAAPIEKPTAAAARLGESLTPSPTMPTGPRVPSSPMAACLSCGSSSARTSSMPSWRAMACAVVGLSPVSMTGVMPSSRNAATASRLLGLAVSATANRASTPPSSASSDTVRPSASWACMAASSAGVHRPCSWIQRWLPSSRAMPSTRPVTPRPAAAANSYTGLASPISPRAMACATGWSERAARLSASCDTRSGSAAPSGAC
mmetsp:Transcript_42313/g.99250  ORF Transcript_42313/g.99250 Transcript_42313/m.99250 type:complete len:270 (+) Transcript_42313:4053-4862(+)